MKKFHIITIGCQMNISDSERIAGYFYDLGFETTEDKYGADIVVLVTCGVRQSAEDRIYGLIPNIKKKNPKCGIILTGCLSERADVKKRLGNYVDCWMPINKILNLKFEILTQFKNFKLNNFNQNNCDKKNCEYLNIKPKYFSSFSAFVPIGNGCDNFCSYCVVPYARGREVYRPAQEIIDEAKELIKNGYKEIFLIAQNVNSYRSNYKSNSKLQIKKNKSVDFSDLLNLLNDLPGDFWIRFATSHPKDMSDKLIETIASCEKVCRHIHLPVQAGDNKILKKMNRNYTIEHYIGLIKKIKGILNNKKKSTFNNLPVSISTDIIVGFPGETKFQFNKTKKLFKDMKFDMAYLAQYSPRPGTAAEKYKDNVSGSEKKRREEELNDVLKKTALEYNKKYINKIVKVLIDTKNKDGDFFGKTNTDKNVKVFNNKLKNKDLLGKFVSVKINKVTNFSMQGVIVNYEK